MEKTNSRDAEWKIAKMKNSVSSLKTGDIEKERARERFVDAKISFFLVGVKTV